MKPWEEKWTLDEEDVEGAGAIVKTPGSDGTFGDHWGPITGDCGVNGDEDDLSRARLAAAAPEMARMLIAVAAYREAQHPDDITESLFVGGMLDAIDDALRKAGVLPSGIGDGSK